jgi:segregation and condensation protein A
MDSTNTTRFTGFRLDFRLKDFEGPLDTLLFRIKKNEVNIYDILVAEITREYLRYIDAASDRNLEDLTEFHVLAATLLHIKSGMLLPAEACFEDEADEPRCGLVEYLISRRRFGKLSELIEDRARETEWVIERKKVQRLLPFADKPVFKSGAAHDLLKTFSALISGLSRERIIDLFEEVSVSEKLDCIAALMESRGTCAFSDLLLRQGSPAEIVCAFLAVLEAAKNGGITVRQEGFFGEILIFPAAFGRSRSRSQGKGA